MTRPQETFTDMLARLFPMPGIQLGINSPHSKCITFQVTEDCNLRCSYCYQGCKTHRKMSLETAKAAVDMLLAADERTNQYITSTEVAGVVLDFNLRQTERGCQPSGRSHIVGLDAQAHQVNTFLRDKQARPDQQEADEFARVQLLSPALFLSHQIMPSFCAKR